MQLMNVLKLNDIIAGNIEKILLILESLGYEDIKERGGNRGKYLQFANIDGDNKGACVIYVDSLKYINYTRGENGNIYTLVMKIKHKSFPGALDYVARVLNINKNDLKQTIVYPFDGFYRDLIREREEPEFSMKIYDESILDDYINQYSQLFFEDGISYNSQQKYKVGYDIWSNRITIPEYTLDGKLCGIMGRLNEKNCDHDERWLPLIPCSRNLTLYGYTNNYNKIQEKDLCVVLESEKAVMQLNTMRCELGLATCGDNISDVQAKYIKGLHTKKTILAYDEGLEEDYIRSQAEKLKIDNPIFRNKVGYIFDKTGEILKKGSKDSPSDLPKAAFCDLMKNHVVWV